MENFIKWLIKILEDLFNLKGRKIMPAILFEPGAFEGIGGATPALTSLNRNSFQHNVLEYDDASDEFACWTFWADQYYDSGSITVDIFWYSPTAITGNIFWKVGISAKTDNEDWSGSVDASGSVVDAAKGTVFYLNKATITITSPTMSPSDLCMIRIWRDADDGSDTLIGDAHFLFAVLKYTVAG